MNIELQIQFCSERKCNFRLASKCKSYTTVMRNGNSAIMNILVMNLTKQRLLFTFEKFVTLINITLTKCEIIKDLN
jgi:hypothetical protein